jgi:hypothetical protein
LDAGAGALGVEKARDPFESRNVLVLPEAQVANRDAALRNHGRRLQNHQPRASLGAAAQMDEMPVGGQAVLARVLAHRRDADAVGKADRTKLKGGEKRMTHI